MALGYRVAELHIYKTPALALAPLTMHTNAKAALLLLIIVYFLEGSPAARQIPTKASQRAQVDDHQPNELWVEYLSWQPRALLFHNFLSEEECQHLINKALPNMEKSTVVDNETGRSKLDSVRTSSGTFLIRGVDEIVKRIEDRIAVQTMLPVDNGEGLQILRYNHGEKYSSHFDYFHDTINTINGGQRVATVLMYLSDVDEGGETVFPDSDQKPNAGNSDFSNCAQAGVAVKPKKAGGRYLSVSAGDALFFYSMNPGSDLDVRSLHGGCPVLKGAKWSATKWIRVGQYRVR